MRNVAATVAPTKTTKAAVVRAAVGGAAARVRLREVVVSTSAGSITRSWDLHGLVVSLPAGCVSRAERAVLLAIPKWADPAGRFWASVKSIATAIGYGRRATQIALASLEIRGLVIVAGSKTGGRGNTVRRRLNIEMLRALAGHTDRPVGLSDPSNDSDTAHRMRPLEEERAQSATENGAFHARKGAPDAHEPTTTDQGTDHHQMVAVESSSDLFQTLRDLNVDSETSERLVMEHPAELIAAAIEGSDAANNPPGWIVARLERPELRERLAKRAEEIRIQRSAEAAHGRVVELLNGLSDDELICAHRAVFADADPPPAEILRKRYRMIKNAVYTQRIVETARSNAQSRTPDGCLEVKYSV